MAKLTKELRDRCAAWLRNLSPSANGGSCGHCVGTVRSLADALAACEVEAEPVNPITWSEVRDAAVAAGWNWIFDGEDVEHFFRGDRHFCVVVDQEDDTVLAAEHAPPDLLDGRLAALNEEVSRGN